MKWGGPGPKVGDTKVETRFAWLPIQIKEYMVWLETYEIVYSYGLFDEPKWHKIEKRPLFEYPC